MASDPRGHAEELTQELRYYAARAAAAAPAAAPGPAPAGAVPLGGPDAAAAEVQLVDIGANLLDPMFQGEYREKPRHEADLNAVLARARAAGVGHIMVTAGALQEAREALALCARQEDSWPQLCSTVGVHPTNCCQFEAFDGGPEAYLAQLLEVGLEGRGRVAAVGECGLDYDRLHFCPRDVQLKYFELQVASLAPQLGLPFFLHCRTSEAAQDLLGLLEKHRAVLPSPPGVVHSFDGTLADAQRFMEFGFYIGINGCSLRTAENLEVVKQLPAERLLLETDAPWCSIKATHAGHGLVRTTWEEVKKPERWEAGKCVKDRCEPCHLRQVLEVVAGCRGEEPSRLAAQVLQNTRRVFRMGEGFG